MKNSLITVIVPVYNTSQYLNQCVNSILGQGWEDLEVILVDDGSTDGSSDICDMFASIDSRVKVVHKYNEGVSRARNVGLDMANGEYISFVDSDDFVQPDMYSRLMSVFDANSSVALASCGMSAFDDTGRQHDYRPEWYIEKQRETLATEYLSQVITQRRCFNIVCKLFRTDLIGGVRFREDILAEDLMFMFDLSSNIIRKGYSMVEIPDRMYFVRKRTGSYCSSGRPIELSSIANYQTMCETLPGDLFASDILEIKRVHCQAIINLNARIRIWPINEVYFEECANLLSNLSLMCIFQIGLGPKMMAKYIAVKYFGGIYASLYRFVKRA